MSNKLALLQSNHLEDLRNSGLSDETIEQLGFRSGTAKEVASILGFNVGPGLVMPYPSTDPIFNRVKPDTPPTFTDGGGAGKPAKYLSPKGTLNRAYIPPLAWEALEDVSVALMIVEGEKKAAKACQEGFPCIGLAGIWGFRDREHDFIPDLEAIRLDGRRLLIAPDSDVSTNSGVRDAVWELGYQLMQRRALTCIVELPCQ